MTPYQRRVAWLFILCSIVILLEAQLKSHRATAGVLAQMGAAWFLSICVHEAGHAAGAALVRFRVRSVGIAPFKLYRAADGVWRVGWAGFRVPGFFAALPDDCHNVRRRAMAVFAAGPGTSVLAAIGFWVATEAAVGSWYSWPAALLISATVFSLYLGVLGFLPSSPVGMGLRILRRPGPQADRYCGLSLLAAAAMAGSPPWDWRSDLVDMLGEPADGSREALGALALKYSYFIHTGRFDEAGQALAIALEKSPRESRAMWFLEASWFAARIRGDLAKAYQALDAASANPSSRFVPYGVARAKAAIALLEQRWEDVEIHARETLRQCNQLVMPGFVMAARKETEALLCDAGFLRAGQPPAIPERSAFV